ncbi:MAG TPA: tRNA pseudouridine(55) synthase TruB [Solirubrobacteraceae bacterium]|nr:tRNA pseudouridine(55) synthase TruB [Solirubrobacteraceae bacterium]
MSPAAGILLADKPAGISSHDVVARARRALGERRIGHAGTLDPFATGLLILLVGPATRLQRFFMALPKTYEVTAKLGASSSTGDPEGEITDSGVFPSEPITLPLGKIRQRPPAYSAVKVDGERAYARARRGETVVLAEREVEIHDWEILWREGDRVGLRIACSSGTYIRSLISDLADAYCLELRRTAIGPFTLENAWPTQGPAALVDVLTACRQFAPSISLDDTEAALLRGGQPVPTSAGAPLVLATDAGGAPIALAERRESEAGATLRPIVAA